MADKQSRRLRARLEQVISELEKGEVEDPAVALAAVLGPDGIRPTLRRMQQLNELIDELGQTIEKMDRVLSAWRKLSRGGLTPQPQTVRVDGGSHGAVTTSVWRSR